MTNPTSADCKPILAAISAYLDGELDSAGCDGVERHCTQCATCAELVRGLRETVGLCRKAGATPLPESVRQRARASVRRLLEEREPEPGV